ncbi:30S ribosomal protein S21 [Planctomycetota bacterium]|nr:30S ribosomal protein S21 [Planctomycetota bacterium]
MARKPNVSISLRRDEPLERALRRFKRMCDKAGIKNIVRAKRFYEKPSDERRREIRKAIRNRRRAERKLEQRQARKMRKRRRPRNFSIPVDTPPRADAAASIPPPASATPPASTAPPAS